ncbi:inclusion membrane protein-19 [Chlamydia suis]|uniref:Inclusion membrane protein-19 n=1 Tax=Chlamydia suis TaxID=83559 RepID=A0ABX6ITR9_9CHLA|nr:hypothetical protein [Chlamydia suis]QHP83297.1 inclusion membrane protein-19 [Chlamydia suis]
MTTTTLIAPSSSPPTTHFSSASDIKNSSSLPKLSLLDTIQRIMAFVALAFVGFVGFLALLGHAVAILIAPQLAVVLSALFILSLAGITSYLYKTTPLHLYQELQKEVESLREVNFMLKMVHKEFVDLSKEFATTSKDLSEVSADFQQFVQSLQSIHTGFDSLLSSYKDSAEELRALFSQDTIQTLKTLILSLKDEIKELIPLAEEVRRLTENKESLTKVVQDLEIIRTNLRNDIDELSNISCSFREQIATQKAESEQLLADIKEALSKEAPSKPSRPPLPKNGFPRTTPPCPPRTTCPPPASSTASPSPSESLPHQEQPSRQHPSLFSNWTLRDLFTRNKYTKL